MFSTKLDGSSIHCLSTGRGFKASVFKVIYGGSIIVLKDYSQAPFLLKPIVRLLVRREIRVLEYLQGSPHVPALVKVLDPYRFGMEYIEGTHPDKNDGITDSGVYREAMEFLVMMHKAGVVHNDLRRKNLIIHPQRGLVFLDFGAALLRPRCVDDNFQGATSPYVRKFSDISPRCWFTRTLQRADIYHLIRIKRSISCEPFTEQEITILQKGRPFWWLTRIWKILFRGKPLSYWWCRTPIVPRRSASARLLSPMRWVFDRNARQRRG